MRESHAEKRGGLFECLRDPSRFQVHNLNTLHTPSAKNDGKRLTIWRQGKTKRDTSQINCIAGRIKADSRGKRTCVTRRWVLRAGATRKHRENDHEPGAK